MKKFLAIFTVAFECFSPAGELFRIKPKDIGVFKEVPEWVKDTLIFKLLLKDGSVKIAAEKEELKKLENDPKDGIDADGKKHEEPEGDADVEKDEEPAGDAGEPVTVVTDAPKAPKAPKTNRKKKDDAK